MPVSAPYAQRHMGYRKIFAQAEIDAIEDSAEVLCRDNRERYTMDFISDRIIFLAELDNFAQLPLKLLGPVPQRKDLSLADRYRAATVRVCDVDLGEGFGVLLKKLRMLLEISCNIFGFHALPLTRFQYRVVSLG